MPNASHFSWGLLGASVLSILAGTAPAGAVATATAYATAGTDVTDGPNIDTDTAGMVFANATAFSGVFGGGAFAELDSNTGHSEGIASADYFGSGYGEALFERTVQNLSDKARTYRYKFTIDAGSVDVEYLGTYLGGDAAASFTVSVIASHEGDTVKVFETGYTVTVEDGVTVKNARTGTDIGYTTIVDGRIGVSWAEYTATVRLPFTLEPGESFDLTYLLTASATADGVETECGYGACGGISSLANAADPFSVPADDLGISSAPVPAPAPAALLAAGLAGMGLARRRQRG